MSEGILSTTVVGSYPQPDWLVDKELMKAHVVPRIRLRGMWRVAEPYLEEAQDDATRLAIRDMEVAGIDIITDGEIRRESYSSRFATSLQGIDPEPSFTQDQAGIERLLPRIVGKICRTHPVEIRDMEFLRANTRRLAKITLPGPFTMSRQAHNDFYSDLDEAVMDYAAAVNEEAHDLQRAGADVIQLDEPWVRNDPESAKRIAVPAINRALQGVSVPTVVHLCFGYAAVVKNQKPSGYSFLPELADSVADQISIEAAQPRLDLGVLKDLAPKKIVLGVIDLADPEIESPEEVARRIERALKKISSDRLVPAPDCGMKYLPRATAFGKLAALANGVAMLSASDLNYVDDPVFETRGPVKPWRHSAKDYRSST
jgi:5-methyltetrahydropteroyltriglutamate--homocysteine methyltransferase